MGIGFLGWTIAAAAMFAVGQITDKVVLSAHIDNIYSRLFFAILAPVLALSIPFFAPVTVLPLPDILALLGAGAIFFLGAFLQYYATDAGEVSEVALGLQMIPLFVLLFSFTLLGTRLTAPQYAGIAVMVVAAVLLAVERPQERLLHISPSTALGAAILAAAVYGAHFTAIEALVEGISVWNVYVWTRMALLPLPLLLLWRRPVRDEVRTILGSPVENGGPWLLAGGVAYLLGNIAFIKAITLAPASIVSAVKAVNPLIVLVLVAGLAWTGAEHFEESLTRERLAVKIFATALFVAGIYLVK